MNKIINSYKQKLIIETGFFVRDPNWQRTRYLQMDNPKLRITQTRQLSHLSFFEQFNVGVGDVVRA